MTELYLFLIIYVALAWLLHTPVQHVKTDSNYEQQPTSIEVELPMRLTVVDASPVTSDCIGSEYVTELEQRLEADSGRLEQTDLSRLTYRAARKLAKSLGLPQKRHGKCLSLYQLRQSIEASLASEPKLVA